jgi:hypothetical protein
MSRAQQKQTLFLHYAVAKQSLATAKESQIKYGGIYSQASMK